MITKLGRAAAIAVGVAMVAAVPAGAFTAAPVQEFRLGVGDVIFADGASDLAEPVIVAPHEVLDPTFCDAELQRCFEYKLTVLEPAERLRVSVDTRKGFQVSLLDPDGKTVVTMAFVSPCATKTCCVECAMT